MKFLGAAVIGLIGGIVSGLFGVGGGLIFVPLLVYILGFNIHTAIGTSLAVVVPTAVAGTLRHGLLHNIDWRAVIFLSLFSIVGSWIGASLTAKLDPALLKRLFAVFLAVVALKMFLQN
jgi:uncharacterized membrane protein YfcA